MMTVPDKRETRLRILNASISLFSRKGYAGVGVREIASAANVNLAMISYYFHGKAGILKEIIERFFDEYLKIFQNIDDPAQPPEICFRELIKKLVFFIRGNSDVFMLVYNELPLDVPEVAEIKARRIGELIRYISGLIVRFGLDPHNREFISAIGSSLISGILAQFRLRPVMQKVFQIEHDDQYYERYIDTIYELFLNGIHGLKSKKRSSKE